MFYFFIVGERKSDILLLCGAVWTEESGSPPYAHDMWTITAVCLSASTPKSHCYALYITFDGNVSITPTDDDWI